MAWQAAFRWQKQLESKQDPFSLRLPWAVKDWAVKDGTEPRDCLGGQPDFRPPSYSPGAYHKMVYRLGHFALILSPL